MIIPADGGQGRRLVLTETSARPFPGFFTNSRTRRKSFDPADTEDDFFFGRKMPLSYDRGIIEPRQSELPTLSRNG
jgi:hypothetical protein